MLQLSYFKKFIFGPQISEFQIFTFYKIPKFPIPKFPILKFPILKILCTINILVFPYTATNPDLNNFHNSVSTFFFSVNRQQKNQQILKIISKWKIFIFMGPLKCYRISKLHQSRIFISYCSHVATFYVIPFRYPTFHFPSCSLHCDCIRESKQPK